MPQVSAATSGTQPRSNYIPRKPSSSQTKASAPQQSQSSRTQPADGTSKRASNAAPAPALAPALAPAHEREDESEDEDDDGEYGQQDPDERGHPGTITRTRGGAGGSTMMVKVISLAESRGELNYAPITNVEFEMEGFRAFMSGTKLVDIRRKLSGVLRKNTSFTFCSDEAAMTASEDISLETYARTLHREQSEKDGSIEVYIAPTTAPTASQGEVLLTPPFQLKFIQMGESASDAINTGSLHSSSFQGKDASNLPMAELRRMIGKMSASPKMHVFCSLDGSCAGDELTLSQYLALDSEGVHEKDGTPSILIRFRKSDAKVSAAAASKFHGASPEVLAMMEQMKPDLTIKDHSAEEFKVDKTGFKVQEELDASQFAAHDATPAKYTAQMDEADWDSTLRNCNLLYGWRINKKTNRVERATTPAFRLKVKTPPVPAVTQQQTQPQAQAQVQASAPKAIEDGSTRAGGTSGDSKEVDTAGDDTASTTDKFTTSSSSNTATNNGAIQTTEPAAQPVFAAEDLAATIPAKLGAIPSFAVNDQSRIQVTTVSSEFQESMAKNHFDSTSVEASVSGGYAGVSVGISAGYSSENSNKSVFTNKMSSKRMIGSYMFPRVDVFLRPEDMEPTDELRQALQRVQTTKDINTLRQLYSTFGHLFCHSVTLGGCLQTTKVVSGTQTSQETEEKEAFKASMGVAVSTPIGIGGSVKASHENSDSNANFKSQTNTSESMSFEATGGNSILAADPAAWSSSVADFNNWRVINQSELTPLVDAIASMTGYGLVKTWLLQAVPKLSQYYVIPESRALHVRFKVACQSPAFAKIVGTSDAAYLGVNPSRPPKPVRLGLQRLAPSVEIQRHVSSSFLGMFQSIDMTVSTTQVDVHTTDAMFFPYCTQAPVLLFPGGNEVGTKQDQTLGQTLWRLEVPTGYSLGPDSLVCVKTCAPISTSADKPAQGADLALTVYRNAQGIFMPAIMSSDEPCYWRLRRLTDTGTSTISKSAQEECYRHGESFRLTWSFADQAAGFRDFTGDMYGRRTYTRPAEIPVNTLCLKVPYPRFETAASAREGGVSLVLSPALTEDPVVQTFNVRRMQDEGEGDELQMNYNLFDLPFRVDYVGNDGVGDSGDFMNVVTDAHQEVGKDIKRWDGGQFSSTTTLAAGTPQAVLAGVLLGPMALPIAGIASILDAIIGF